MIEAFKKRIIKIKSGNNKKSYFYLSCNNNDTLFISLNEKNYIFKKLSRMKVYPWKSDISHNLNLIQPDQIDKIFQDSTKKCTDFYKQFYASRYYTISRPIFIRNKKLCFFFYTIQGRGLLDIHGDFSIYSKKNRIWQHLTYITIWEG